MGWEKELKNALSATTITKTNETLVLLFGEIMTDNYKSILKFLEKLLKIQPNNSYVLLALGKVCVNAKLWGRAKDYLEASVGLQKLPETYLELAGLANIMQDHKSANQYYKKGFLLDNY